MAGQPERSKYQKGIIRRYYEKREEISTQRLGEIVTELYLADSEKKKARLWEQAEKALYNAGANKAWLEKVVADKDVEGLAEIVQSIF
jgi:hypothetical protein